MLSEKSSTVRHVKGMLSAITDARLVVYRGAGHSPNWEEPARVARDIESFLRSSVAHADAS